MENKTHKWTTEQTQSAKTPNFWKKYIGEPELMRMIWDVTGKKILELWSGNWYWLELLSSKWAKCTWVELATEQITAAQISNSDIKYIHGDITTLNQYDLEKNYFDIILLEHVLLEIDSREKLYSIMKHAFDVLKKWWHIIVSDLHPFAPSAWPHNIRTSPNYHYFASGEVFEIISQRVDWWETAYRDFHWTLSDLIGVITKAWFYIAEITEPKPSEQLASQYPELEYRLKIPMSFWIKWVKI
jgi:SAM-dependent methyltransferase